MNWNPTSRTAAGIGNYRLPMTSMIDVVFLLLVFFLVTTSFSAEEDRLSSAAMIEGDGVPQVSGPIVIELVQIRTGTLYKLGARELRDVPALGEVLRALRSEDGVVIRASDDVPIASVAAVMQAAQDAGHTKRSYVGNTSN